MWHIITHNPGRLLTPDQVGHTAGMSPTSLQEEPGLDDFWLPDFCSAAGATRLALLSVLTALILLLAQSPQLWPFPLWDFVLLTLLSGSVVGVSFGLICRYRRRMRAWSHLRIAVLSVALLVFNLVWLSLLGIELLAWLGLPMLSFVTNELNTLVRHVLIVTLFAGLFMRYLALQARLRRREKAALQLRLEALQARIQPHFLFNSMNIIASLIAIDPDKAEQVVEDLALLFRASLKDTVDVPLADELSLCRRYARIEELRLGDRLRIDWQLPETLEDVRIPLLTLQPLLENAIRHGVELSAEVSTIVVRVELTSQRVGILLRNPLPAANRGDGNQMSLRNVRERLQARYGRDAYLTAAPEGDSFVTRLGYARPPIATGH